MQQICDICEHRIDIVRNVQLNTYISYAYHIYVGHKANYDTACSKEPTYASTFLLPYEHLRWAKWNFTLKGSAMADS